ncbi:MAG: class II aldolase/adducin family protein [Deltaproteobacteria bacterium]|nr:class II aldolase/adducin family protein [Deltaproteobacteria bacterium]
MMPYLPSSHADDKLRAHVVEVCRRMYQHGFIAAADGNVSVRLDGDFVLLTPSGLHKGYLTPGDLVVCDLNGNRVAGHNRPSSEFLLHRAYYTQRPDVRAVVHAHPPITVALALAGVSLEPCILTETYIALGPVPTVPYATPTTDEVPAALRPFVAQANAVILDRHGSVTVGETLDEAYNRLESLEHSARIIHAAQVIGRVTPLPTFKVAKLRAVKDTLRSK